jgi:hypothetical protein
LAFEKTMYKQHAGFWLTIVAGLIGISGACSPWKPPWLAPALPPKLPPSPTLTQVIEAVNGNHGRIQSLYSNQAAISGQGFGSLRTTVAFQRPRNFRLSAGTAFGTELDLGSNDLYFWFWVKRGEPPAMFWCRHDQYAANPAARQTLPIQPDWLIEALGVTSIDPASNPQGPYALPDGRLQVVTLRNSPDGPLKKVLTIDAAQGWILEQQIINQQNVLLARSTASRYRQDPLSGIWMPGVVDISCPAAQFSMQIDLGAVEINRLQSKDTNLWSMQPVPGAPIVDLAHPPAPQAAK